MASGYTGRILRVDLTTGRSTVADVPERLRLEYLGGRGFGARFLYDEVGGGVDPLGPDNKVMIFPGPLGGTRATSASRWVVVTKSPLTGAYLRSVAGGEFGAWLKFAGFDGLVIEGAAERPVTLVVRGDGAEVRDAGDIWGLETGPTQEALRRGLGERCRVACIGPAGEKLIKFACVLAGRRAAGRGGVGAVLGAKKLKAIVVDPGENRTVAPADPEAFRTVLAEVATRCRKDPMFKTFAESGTTGSAEFINFLGMYPVRNFRRGVMDGCQAISGEAYARARTRHAGCFACPARCGKVHVIAEGPWSGAVSEGPDYETIWAFSGPTDVADLGATVAADQFCDEQGMDTISAGQAIGFAFELYERGLIDRATTGGVSLEYGEAQAMFDLLKKIARREGLGDLLAEGTRRAAQTIGKGAEAYAMQVKGLELPAYEPRGAKAHGLGLATSNIGASHNLGYAGQELFGSPVPRPVDRFSERGKGDIVKYNQDVAAYQDCAVLCSFPGSYGWVDEQILGRFLSAATGYGAFSETGYLMTLGDRVYTLERLFNMREGLGRKDDHLPRRLIEEPLAGGPADGQVFHDYEGMLDDYYAARGWDREGRPTPEKLRELGL